MGSGWVSWCMVAWLAAASAPTEGVRRAPSLNVVYELDDAAGVPSGVLESAETEVRRLFGRIGIQLQRSHRVADASGGYCLTLPNHAGLRVFIVGEETFRAGHAGPQVLGFIARTDGGPGRAAFVAYRRILALAGRLGVPPARLLARVIAHELGHLLLPAGRHASRGLMRAQWWRTDILSGSFGTPQLSAEQIGVIQNSLAAPPRPSAGSVCPAAAGER